MALNSQAFSLPFHLSTRVERALEVWRAEDRLARLWRRDPSLWTSSGEDRWLGWLDAPGAVQTVRYEEFAKSVCAAGFSDVVLLGMGGSVLAPAVMAQVFGHRQPFPRFHVLDSVDPSQIRGVEQSLNLKESLVIVSSKSGTTLESSILMAHFLERFGRELGPSACGEHFVAITDPGTELELKARKEGFRWVCLGRPDIGGRFSVFTAFGLLPMALMGVDVGAFIGLTEPMVDACGPNVGPQANPGVLLGITLAVLSQAGHDKVSLVLSPSIRDLGLWLEQLLAESTGKRGMGLIPIVGEEFHPPGWYGEDRVFVWIGLAADTGTRATSDVAALEESGKPVIRIEISDPLAIGQEFFRWEVATAVIGSELHVNPFDQPDVEISKVITRELMTRYAMDGSFPLSRPVFEDEQVSVFWPGERSPAAAAEAPADRTLQSCLESFLSSIAAGDYVALLAYSPMDKTTVNALEVLRANLGREGSIATTLGFGPRYLHSSGQLHKGGPDSGVFVVVVSEDLDDIPVPARPYTFGVVKTAQARADVDALVGSGRRVIRIEIRGSFVDGIRHLTRAVSNSR